MESVTIAVPADLVPVINLHIEHREWAQRTQSSGKHSVETTYQRGNLQDIQDERKRFGLKPRN